VTFVVERQRSVVAAAIDVLWTDEALARYFEQCQRVSGIHIIAMFGADGFAQRETTSARNLAKLLPKDVASRWRFLPKTSRKRCEPEPSLRLRKARHLLAERDGEVDRRGGHEDLGSGRDELTPEDGVLAPRRVIVRSMVSTALTRQ
jgi:hypothetical protein